MMNVDSLKFNENGLIPAVVQDSLTGRLLMMAWMSEESLEITKKEGFACFFSRSRGTLWRKGETSGNTQRVVSIAADCDADCLLVRVIPSGPACHTGSESCFFQPVFETGEDVPAFSLERLYRLIEGRKNDRAEGSYTSYLFEKGEDKILKKVGEECTEVVIAAKNCDNAELIYELADLCYHAMVLMAQKGIPLGSVLNEMASRHVVDKKVKQEKMTGAPTNE